MYVFRRERKAAVLAMADALRGSRRAEELAGVLDADVSHMLPKPETVQRSSHGPTSSGGVCAAPFRSLNAVLRNASSMSIAGPSNASNPGEQVRAAQAVAGRMAPPVISNAGAASKSGKIITAD